MTTIELPQAMKGTVPMASSPADIQQPTKADTTPRVLPSAAGELSDPQANTAATTIDEPPVGRMTELRIRAEMYEDIQKARIACANRAQRGGVDSESYEPQLAALAAAEKELGKAMRKAYKRLAPPAVIAWQESALGIGDHLLARLLGVIGHPVVTTPHRWEEVSQPSGDTQTWRADLPRRQLIAGDPHRRTLSQLRAYCGHGDPTRRRRKGQDQGEAAANGNPRAKMLVHLLAEAAVKAGVRRLPDAPVKFDPDSRKAISPYGEAYIDRRRATWERDWTDLHKQNDALRIVGKEILRDLRRAAS